MESARISISYLSLRRMIGLIALSHPAILYFGGLEIFGLALQPSMSDYYHTPMRDVFVGLDVLTGGFLLCYHGYDRKDKSVAVVAGVCAILAALFPTDNTLLPGQIPDWVSRVHSIAAVLFMLAIAYFCLFLFVKSDPKKVMHPRKKQRNSVYRFCGSAIVGVIVTFILYTSVPALKAFFEGQAMVFWLEAIAFVFFGIAWLVKGETLLAD